MKLRGPIITLLAVVGVALVLLIINLSKSSTDDTANTAAAASTAETSSAAPAETSAAAAAPAAFPAEAKYVGKTQGKKDGEAPIAITVKAGKASAYLCDGKAIEAWYNGTATDGKLELTGKNGNALTGTLSGDTVTGTVSAGGKSWSFSAKLATKPAGLYRASSGTTTVGWIKQPDGTVTGLANQNGTLVAAPPLDIATAQAVEGTDQVVGP